VVYQPSWCTYEDIYSTRPTGKSERPISGVTDSEFHMLTGSFCLLPVGTAHEKKSVVLSLCRSESPCINIREMEAKEATTLSPRPFPRASKVSRTCVTRSRVGSTIRARSRVTILVESIYSSWRGGSESLNTPLTSTIGST
jgi:hypothetical protein